MAEFERVTTVGVGIEAAFEYFADPANLPQYLAVAELVESTAEAGEETAETPTPGGVTFLADREAQTVRWSRGEAYGGSIQVKKGTPSMSDVVIRLRTRDDADPDEVRKVIEASVRAIGRRLSGR